MSFSRKALLALTGFAALAMPLAVAGSASAATNASGCTVNPLKPVYDHMNSSGQKVIKYETTVYCEPGRSIQIQDERFDQDWTSPDDSYGTTTYNIRFNGASTEYKSVLKVLPDADAWATTTRRCTTRCASRSPATTASSRRGPPGRTARR